MSSIGLSAVDDNIASGEGLIGKQPDSLKLAGALCFSPILDPLMIDYTQRGATLEAVLTCLR